MSRIAGILINVVGFADAVGTPNIPVGARYIYNVNFFGGFIVSSAVYYLLSRFFPVPACSDKWLEVGDEITDVSLVYDHSSGSQREFDEEAGVDSKKYDHDSTKL